MLVIKLSSQHLIVHFFLRGWFYKKFNVRCDVNIPPPCSKPNLIVASGDSDFLRG